MLTSTTLILSQRRMVFSLLRFKSFQQRLTIHCQTSYDYVLQVFLVQENRQCGNKTILIRIALKRFDHVKLTLTDLNDYVMVICVLDCEDSVKTVVVNLPVLRMCHHSGTCRNQSHQEIWGHLTSFYQNH